MPLSLLLDRMNVITTFALEKVGFTHLIQSNGHFPFQVAAALRTRARIVAEKFHGLLHFKSGDAPSGHMVQTENAVAPLRMSALELWVAPRI
jgi:hypothetical protein